MSICKFIIVACLAAVVFSFGGSPCLWMGRDLHGPLPDCPSLFLGHESSLYSPWSQDKMTVVAATDKDSKDSDGDKKDVDDKDDGNERMQRELWDLVMLG